METDARLADRLRKALAHDPDFHLLVGDILKVHWAEAIQRHLGASEVFLVSNLPYQISSPVLGKMMDAEACWRRAVLMFQQEFADRLTASPGTAAYGALSVLVQSRWTLTALFRVPPGHFHPPPKVWSVVLRIDPRPTRRKIIHHPRFAELIRAGFRHRRKTLLNNLRLAWIPSRISRVAAWIERREHSLSVRPQDLTPDEWCDLAEELLPRTPSLSRF